MRRFTLLLYAVLLIILSGCGNAADADIPNSEKISKPVLSDESNCIKGTKKEDIPDDKTSIKPESKSESKNNEEHVVNQEAATAKVHISITGHKDVGIILADTAVNIDEGDTVIDVLKRTAELNSIQLECSGIKAMAYVKGIGNTYEFDYGPKSGWIYRVNGEISNVGAGKYEVKDGDYIEWLYTVDLGREFDTESGGAQE